MTGFPGTMMSIIGLVLWLLRGLTSAYVDVSILVPILCGFTISTCEQYSILTAEIATCSHLSLYIKGEWHLVAPNILRVYLLLSVLMLSLQGVHHHPGLQPAIADYMI